MEDLWHAMEELPDAVAHQGLDDAEAFPFRHLWAKRAAKSGGDMQQKNRYFLIQNVCSMYVCRWFFAKEPIFFLWEGF